MLEFGSAGAAALPVRSEDKWPFIDSPAQAAADRILKDVVGLLGHLAVIPQTMVKESLLPLDPMDLREVSLPSRHGDGDSRVHWK
jgi:hypothetical protein